MKVGTKTLLVGYHQVLLHPLVVAVAWWKLYGVSWDPRVWVAIVVHDWGYWGCRDMDGHEGQWHPVTGAFIMHRLFDRKGSYRWWSFSCNHSRRMAKLTHDEVSPLCLADKLAFVLYPPWLLKVLYRLSGEAAEYVRLSGAKSYDEWYRLGIESNKRTLKEHYDGVHNQGKRDGG